VKFSMLKAGLLLAVAVASPVSAGCLDGLTTTSTITSKVKAMHVKYGQGSAHYVILEPEACKAAASGDATLGANTKASHQLRISSADSALLDVLLRAQEHDRTISFRLVPGAPVGDFNEISYVISPASGPVVSSEGFGSSSGGKIVHVATVGDTLLFSIKGNTESGRPACATTKRFAVNSNSVHASLVLTAFASNKTLATVAGTGLCAAWANAEDLRSIEVCPVSGCQ
jgi:hypothetical protein